jgi:integrase
MMPARAQISAKRWANLRSDLAAAIEASGLRPMLKTAGLDLDEVWSRLLAPADQRVRHALSRYGRWASLRRIGPEAVDDSTIDRFVAELDGATLIRNLRNLPRTVAKAWNGLVELHKGAGLRPVPVPTNKPAPTQIPWQQLPASFQENVERYVGWAAVPDPLAEGARARALAPLSLRLQRTHIHSAATAAAAAGVPLDQITSLASLVEPDTFRALMGHLWRKDGRKLSAFTHGVAVTLIAIASDWVKAPADTIATLKTLRSKLGTLPTGLTDKNKGMLRTFEDPRLLDALVHLPNKLWRTARRGLATSRRPFIDLQSALAIDILLHVPMRMQNLASLNFETHLHWPQGRRSPAVITFRGDETKNGAPLEFEIAPELADRLLVYRNEIAPAVIGKRPDAVFVTFTGKPRTQAALKVAIERTVRRHLGVKMTPHQFRHVAAKISLDAHPHPHESLRELLAHRNLRTTTNFSRLHLPYGEWPAADRLLWQRAMGSDDPFADAAGARLAKASQHTYLFAWRRFLGFLAIHEPTAFDVAPAERLTIERVRLFAAHLAESNIPRSVASQVHALYLAARVMMPERDWTWLKKIKARLFAAAPAPGASGPVITSVQLLDLGQQLMDEKQPTAVTAISIDDAVRFRDGMLLAFVAFIPIRRKNLAALEIGRHLVREGDGWFVIIPGEETKTGTPIEFPVPELLESYLANYLDIVRPRMLRHPSCAALWVSSQGGALVYGAIGQIFSRHSTSRLGFRITPHDARDAAATTWAISMPHQIGVARDLLTHSDLRTTIKHYNRARGIEASRAHSRVIAAMRRKQNRRS